MTLTLQRRALESCVEETRALSHCRGLGFSGAAAGPAPPPEPPGSANKQSIRPLPSQLKITQT